MTVVRGIEVDQVIYTSNEIKNAILNNDPIEDKLNVIIVISNPLLFKRRYQLTKEFISRMETEESVRLFIVELCYKNQPFVITNSNNKNHLQLKGDEIIWHKENMINLGVKYLLPSNWKAMAWIDADLEFENPDWAISTLKILNGAKDIIQLWSHCDDMDRNNMTMSIFHSFGYEYCKGKQYTTSNGLNYWHPGFAWACTRKAYEKMNGLFETAILGSGDNIMALSLIKNGIKGINPDSTDGYKKKILEFQNSVKNLRLGYIPGIIRHHYHGSKKNRKYTERWKILLNHNFDPYTFLKKNDIGLLVPTKKCSRELLDEIYKYFKERNEDEK
jgi:hypothetical protein